MAAARCPICRKPAGGRGANPSFPFCSKRCKLLDLGKWLGEEYRVPGGRAGDGAAVSGQAANDEGET